MLKTWVSSTSTSRKSVQQGKQGFKESDEHHHCPGPPISTNAKMNERPTPHSLTLCVAATCASCVFDGHSRRDRIFALPVSGPSCATMLTSATSLWMDASTETAGVDFRDGSDPGPDHVRTLSTLSTVSASHQELPGHGPLAYLDDSSASYLLKRLFTTAELEEDEPIRPTDVHSRLQTLLLSQPKQLLREQSSIHPDDLRASAPSLDDELKQSELIFCVAIPPVAQLM